MKKNITLSAEEAMIENARKVAQSENRTLNAAFREWLQQYQARGSASAAYREVKKKLSHVISGRKFSRDEMNER